jgi:hypothetical protein
VKPAFDPARQRPRMARVGDRRCADPLGALSNRRWMRRDVACSVKSANLACRPGAARATSSFS